MTDGPSVVFRCDGSYSQGFGHLVRCLALADELQNEHGCTVVFAMKEDDHGVGMARCSGYRAVTPVGCQDVHNYETWFQGVCHETQSEVVVLDIRDDLSRETVRNLREAGNLMVSIDDPSDRRLDVDLVFYPPVPQVEDMDWSSFSGERFSGWEWVILRPEFAQPLEKRSNPRPVILVTMGGSDPAGMTWTVLDALACVKETCHVLVIVGPGYRDGELLEERKHSFPHSLEVLSQVEAMHEVLARADLAIVSFGVTAYELAAMHVPAMYLCLSQDHARSASLFHKEGLGENLGVVTHVTSETLIRACTEMLNEPERRALMRQRSCQLAIGRGVYRVAGIIMERVKQRREHDSTVARA